MSRIRGAYMLALDANSHDVRRKAPQDGKPVQCFEHRRGGRALLAGQYAADDPVLNKELNALDDAHRKNSPLLNRRKFLIARPATVQRFVKKVRGGDCILDRQIDSDATDRRHGVRRIADAQKAGPIPLLHPVNRNGEQLDVIPALELLDAIAEPRRKLADLGPKRRQARAVYLFGRALGDDKRALPIIAAIELDEHVSGFDATQGLVLVVR